MWWMCCVMYMVVCCVWHNTLKNMYYRNLLPIIDFPSQMPRYAAGKNPWIKPITRFNKSAYHEWSNASKSGSNKHEETQASSSTFALRYLCVVCERVVQYVLMCKSVSTSVRGTWMCIGVYGRECAYVCRWGVCACTCVCMYSVYKK